MNMQVASFDILTGKGGFSPQAARAVGEVIDLELHRASHELTTRAELKTTETALEEEIRQVRTEINRVETALKAEIRQFDAALRADLNRVETELKAEIKRFEMTLEVKLHEVKVELMRWVLLVNIGWGAVAATITVLINRLAH